jgi:dimethylamine/trimethylamine dehydrogenase
MSSYTRVRDYREYQLSQKANVDIYLDNRLSAEDVIALEIPHVLVATGSRWRNNGCGRRHAFAVVGIDTVQALTPDDVLAGAEIRGRVLIYDDDHYFMGSTLAERLRAQGHEVCLLTPESVVSQWTINTLEQDKIQARLLDLDVDIVVSHALCEVSPGKATIASVYSDRLRRVLEFDTLVMVTSRDPDDGLFQSLQPYQDRLQTLRAVGDCNAPGTVAAAVYDGHSAARHLQSPEDIYAPLFVRDMPTLE